MPKERRSANINQPRVTSTTGLVVVSGGGGGGSQPGTLTGSTTNTITSAGLHYHAVQLAHSALLGVAADDHHAPVTVGNTGLSIAGQQVSLRLATVSGLELSSGLRLADSIAGAGLGIANKVLAVGAGDGISVGADTVAVSLASPAGLSFSSGALQLDDAVAGAGLTISAKVLGIDLATNSGLELSGSPAKLHLRTPSSASATSTNTVTDVLGHTHAVTAYSDLATYPGHLAKADASGDSTWHRIDLTDRLRTPHIDSATGQGLTIAPDEDLSLSPVSGVVKATSGVAVGSDHYVSQMTGWRAGYDGGADFRYLFTDELHAKSFIADLEQALAGGQIICKSVAVVAEDFAIPAAGAAETLVVEDLPGAAGQAVFQSGDIVRLRQFTRGSGSLTIADCWGVVTGYSDNGDGTQDWTFTRSSGAAGGTAVAGSTIAPKTLALDYGVSGNGFYEVNAIDGLWAQNSPYAQVVTWTTHPQSGQVVRSRWGNLRGIFAAADDYGLYAAVDGHTDADQYLRISSQGARLNNLPLEMYSGGDKVLALDPTAPDIALGNPIPTGWLSESGFWTGRHTDGSYRAYIGTVSGGALAAGWQWDGSTLTVRGTIVVQAGSSGISNLSDAGALATKNSVDLATGDVTNKNLDNVADGSTYKRVTANEKTGAARGYSGLDSNAYVSRVIRGAAIAGGSAATGLNLTADYLGYYDGTAFRTYLDKNGNFLFSKAGGASLLWSASAGKLQGRDSSNNVQWETDASTGAIVAGAGNLWLDTNGLSFGIPDVFGPRGAVTWYDGAGRYSYLASWYINLFPAHKYLRLAFETGPSIELHQQVGGIPTPTNIDLSAGVVNISNLLTVGANASISGGLNVGTATGAGPGEVHATGGQSVFQQGNTNDSVIKVIRGDNTSQYLTFQGYQITSHGNNLLLSANDSTRGIWFLTAGSEAMRITHNQRVLIGTTSDNGYGRLQVQGGGIWTSVGIGANTGFAPAAGDIAAQNNLVTYGPRVVFGTGGTHYLYRDGNDIRWTWDGGSSSVKLN